MDSVWALSYLTDCGNTYIQAVIGVGVVPKLVSFLTHSEIRLQVKQLTVSKEKGSRLKLEENNDEMIFLLSLFYFGQSKSFNLTKS